jgi:hypothetical protein
MPELAKHLAWSGYAVWRSRRRCPQYPFDFAQGGLFGTEVPQDDCIFVIYFKLSHYPLGS